MAIGQQEGALRVNPEVGTLGSRSWRYRGSNTPLAKTPATEASYRSTTIHSAFTPRMYCGCTLASPKKVNSLSVVSWR